MIVLHLGNGASICAVREGKSDRHLDGHDAARGPRHGHPLRRPGSGGLGLHRPPAPAAGRFEEIDLTLNKAQRPAGPRPAATTCATSTPPRPKGDEAAQLALDAYCYRIRKYIGAYLAALGRVDAVVFTAGVGENSATVPRRRRRRAGPPRHRGEPEAERAAVEGGAVHLALLGRRPRCWSCRPTRRSRSPIRRWKCSARPVNLFRLRVAAARVRHHGHAPQARRREAGRGR